MFQYFENILDPTRERPIEAPPAGLAAFYWHFAGQARWLFAVLFVAGLLVAIVDASIPYFIGRLVNLVATTPPERLFADGWPVIATMMAVVLIGRPLAVAFQSMVSNQAITANVTNLIRWQSHRHVVRQSWPFFQNDFAGRIASRVMETGYALRESVVTSINAVWGICVYGVSALGLLATVDLRLAIPIMIWFVCYATLLRVFVPRLRDRSKRIAEARSMIIGRIVDSYTNILTLKLFAKLEREDAYVQEAVEKHTSIFRRQLRMITVFSMLLSSMNALLLTTTAAIALVLWSHGLISVGAIAMALPLTWQITTIAGTVAQQVTGVFENIGTVQEGMLTIARPVTLVDKPDAKSLVVSRGEIRFDDVSFGYGRESGLIKGLNLTVRPGEKIGLVGRSGAGKTTLVNLLLRFHDLEDGRILIDGQSIADVDQESLRSAIAVVTQDTSLLHRSIRENIAYGRPGASDEEIRSAAERASAHAFILDLEDWHGRRGYDAHVGERGVKLSGGQRQRIAIARVILKDAPILVLDEATSALDSEVEAAIQDSLAGLMAGKTVIAIAHRLSTIARMDRLVVMDRGRVIETGTHEELISRGGLYADLWKRQSGGFIDAA
jgi:ATP-binding cassette subfamily B multidrug efflux pump